MSTTLVQQPVDSRNEAGNAPIRLSATKIKTYLLCPRQFRYRYVDELRTALTGALAFGKVIHKVIHDMHQRSIWSGEPIHETMALSHFALLWEQAVSEHPVFKSDDEIEKYAQLGDLMLLGYVESQKDKPPPFLLEFPFQIEISNQNEGDHVVLAGVIDRLDEVDDGLVVIDYKTGKRKPSRRELASDIQLSVYAFAARELFGQEVKELVIYHLRDQTPLKANRSKEQLEQLTHFLIPHIVHGINDLKFAPKIGYWCNFCEFKSICLAEGPDAPCLDK